MHIFADDRGHSLLSLFDHLPEIPGQINVSTMYAGVVKAWHRHARQEDHWIVLAGNLKVGLFNTESRSLFAELRLPSDPPGNDRQHRLEVAPNSGLAVYLGEHRPGILHIPAGLWHGGVAVGGRDAVLLYYTTRKYDPRDPDEQRRTWDAFPFSWGASFK